MYCDTLRQRLLLILQEEGVRQSHIAYKTQIGEGLLSRFKNGKKELGLIDREALDKYLTSKGY